jgi:siroheme synthase
VAADAQDHQLGTPAIILIGEIVRLRERLMEVVREGEAAT